MTEKGMAMIAISFAIGILAAEYISFSVCVLLAVFVYLVTIVFLKSPKIIIAIITAAFVLGSARYIVTKEISTNDISNCTWNTTSIWGNVASDPEGDPDKVRFILKATRAKVSGRLQAVKGKVMVSMYSSDGKPIKKLEYGDRIRLDGHPYPPLDPTNPGQFSWKAYLQRQGIYTCISVRDASNVHKLNENTGNIVIRAALRARHFIARGISKLHSKEDASVIIGMVLGTYAYLPPEIFDDFGRTGTLHLLAASGYNCYILLALASPILRRLRVLPKYREWVVIGLIIFYLFIAGAKPSLVRAAVMSSLMLLSVPLNRVGNFKNIFFVAALSMLVYNPANLFDVGFQLSFLAVWSLISVVPILQPLFKRPDLQKTPHPRRHNVSGYIRRKMHDAVSIAIAAAVATVAISLVTAPIVAYYFNYISLVSVPANIALEAGVPIVFGVGFASSIVAYIPWIGAIVGFLGTLTMHCMLAVVNGLGSLKYAAISVAPPNLGVMIGYYIMLIALLSYVRSRFAEK